MTKEWRFEKRGFITEWGGFYAIAIDVITAEAG